MKAEPFEIGDAFSLRAGERVQLRIDGIDEVAEPISAETLAKLDKPVLWIETKGEKTS